MPLRLRLLVLLVLLAAPAAAQRATDLVRWTAAVAPGEAAPGGAATLRLRASIAAGWKLYALDTPPPAPALRVTIPETGGVTAGAPRHPDAPHEQYDPNLEANVRSFTNAVGVDVPLRVEASAAAGPRALTADVLFTICDTLICLPPTRIAVEATFAVTSAAVAGPATLAPSPADSVAAPAGTLDGVMPDAPAAALGDAPTPAPTQGVLGALDVSGVARASVPGLGWGFLLLALGAGLGALLTPCVFPMLPLTVSYFTRHTASRGEAVRMALLYGGSIVGTFTGLGLLMALIVGAAGAGRIASNPYVNLFIGLVFVLFGLSLLGLFELRLPAAFVNRVSARGAGAGGEARNGAAGVVFMGLTLTLVSFSCTMPFVGALLAAAAQGAWARPLVGMLVFSTVFALPFVGFALFPRALERLPRSGAWMDAVKVTLGFVELAAAIKFLSQADLVWGTGLLSRPLAVAFVAVLFALCGLYLVGLVRLGAAREGQIGAGRLVAAVGFLGTALYLVPGLFGANLGLFDAYLPPRTARDFSLVSSATPPRSDGAWLEGSAGLDAAKAEAARTGRPIFIDFTGYTCTNCRFMEANVFTEPAVAERLSGRFVRVRLYTDGADEGEALQRYQLQLTGTVALPTYAILAPDGRTLLARHSGIARAPRFAAFLDEGVGRAPQRLAKTG